MNTCINLLKVFSLLHECRVFIFKLQIASQAVSLFQFVSSLFSPLCLKVVLLAVFSMSRSIIFSGVFFLQLQAGVIARAAALSFIYHKLSRLKSVGNKSVGEVQHQPLDTLCYFYVMKD